MALTKYFEGDEDSAMFYLGAACHLVQDVTVPQHVNINLLKHHRKYEQWIIKAFEHHEEFKVREGGIYLNSVKAYMDHNSVIAMDTYDKYEAEEDLEVKFYNTTLVVLRTAQKTTAGLMLNFYDDVEKLKAQAGEYVENKMKMLH